MKKPGKKTNRKTKINNNEWMVYSKSSATGHAGEYLFAYWISRYFEWPCRLLDIDMGIDAQVEVYTADNRSTGSFIGVQIKTTADEIKSCGSVPLDLNNLVYWSTFNDPVIVVLISLNRTNHAEEPDIYWQHLNKDLIDGLISKAQKNKEKKTRLSFSKTSHVLSPHHYREWSRLWMRQEDKEYVGNIKDLHNELNQLIDDYCRGEEYGDIRMPESGIDFCVDLNRFMNNHDELNAFKGSHKQLTLQFPDIIHFNNAYVRHIENLKEAFDAIAQTEKYYITEDINKYAEPINHVLQNILSQHGFR